MGNYSYKLFDGVLILSVVTSVVEFPKSICSFRVLYLAVDFLSVGHPAAALEKKDDTQVQDRVKVDKLVV